MRKTIIVTLILFIIFSLGTSTDKVIGSNNTIKLTNPSDYPLPGKIAGTSYPAKRFAGESFITSLRTPSDLPGGQWGSVLNLGDFATAQSSSVIFSASPVSGLYPLEVQFSDESLDNPTGWAWYFGDENFSNPWTQVTASAEWSARMGQTSLLLPDRSIVLIGDSFMWTPDVWRSTDLGATWTQMTAYAEWLERGNSSSVVLPDGSIVLMGGQASEGYKNDVWRSTDMGVTWTQMTANAGWSPRWGHSSVVLPDGSIVLTGGIDHYINGWKNDVWRSTDMGTTWTQMTVSAAWSGRYVHTSVVLPDDSIVLMGGADYDGLPNDAWRSTDMGATWTQMTASAAWSGRIYHTSVVLPDGSIVLMGGRINTTNANDIWRSGDMGATWTQVAANADWSPRYGHSSLVLPDGSVLLMGGEGGVGPLTDIYRWETAGSNAQHPVHTYTQPGFYPVSLQAFTPDSVTRITKADYITVQSEPAITSADHVTFLTAASNTFTITATGFPLPALSYSGTIPEGITFVDNGDGSATLAGSPIPGSAGTYNITITANNGSPLEDTQTFSLFIHEKPVANAGLDQSVDTLSTVALDGSDSSDPDGNTPLTYEWTQTSGPAVTLNSNTSANPTFTAPANPTSLTFSLVVTDSLEATSLPDEVVITVNNQAPLAIAGLDQSVDTLSTVTLDGSASSDPDGDTPLTYEWTQTSGTAVTLSSTTSPNPTFTAPANPTSLTFSLVVTDSLGASSTPDEVIITVNNQAPTANAGMDQTVDTLTIVTLDGKLSSDPDGDTPITYAWTQTVGTTVTLSSTTSPNPTFTAPDDPATLTFSLVVTDSLGTSSASDEVVITVNNQAPTANAGLDQSVDTLSTVTLDGSASSDPDGDLPLANNWQQTSGTPVTLNTPTTDKPSFTAPITPGTLTFTLVVTDTIGSGSSADEVTITVNNQPPIVGDIPDKEIVRGESFGQINLYEFVADADNADEVITWSVSGNSNLDVSIIRGVASVTPKNTNWTGSETITFTATDPYSGVDEDTATFTILMPNAVPIISSINPPFVYTHMDELPLSLHVFGQNFINGSLIQWDGVQRADTVFISETELSIDLTAIDLAIPGVVEISVFTPAPGGGTSAAMEFVIAGISPDYEEKLTLSKVQFDWDGIPNATAYRIQLSTKPDFSVVVLNIKTTDSQHLFETYLKYNKTYYWRIRPIFGAVKGNWSPVFKFISMDPLTAPTLDSPPHKEFVNSPVPLVWIPVPNAVYYKVEVAKDSTFLMKIYTEKLGQTTKEFTGSPGRYFWRVRAFDGFGAKGPWSEVRIFKVTLE